MNTDHANKLSHICKYGNMIIILIFAVYFFLWPAGIITANLWDKNIQGRGIPRMAWRLHRSLSPRFEKWAKERMADTRPLAIPTTNISGTEWPVFGSAFYLWATESLQEAWEKDKTLAPIAPKEYARSAISAAADFLNDPKQGSWVRKHWGEDYLHKENVFYRMLLIAGLTSRIQLLGETQYLPTLRERVDSLVKDIDSSPYGLLEDYPGECYPSDVVTAIACIRRADVVLGMDHSAFADRAIRGFQGNFIDRYGLSPYMALAHSPIAVGTSRGCNNSYICLFAPEIWPAEATKWYDAYEKYFWQDRWLGMGFREFPKDIPDKDWYFDVDSGPVIAGHGIAASAFGLGAARVNGHFDHSYPLFAEMLVTAWPLPDGTLAGPRILSDAIDAPYVGEAAILFNITRQPVSTAEIKKGGSIPIFVYLVLGLYFIIGIFLIFGAVISIRNWLRRKNYNAPAPKTQFIIWLILVLGGITTATFINLIAGLLMLILGQLIPRERKL